MRPILYVKEDSLVRGNKNIPRTFLNEEKYYFDERGILYDRKTNLPKIKNSGTAGKPRLWVVNFQDIWNQKVTKQSRAIRVDKVKEAIIPYLKNIEPLTEFPIEVSIILYDIKMPTDISNKGVIYTKVIEDLLTTLEKIPDDNVDFVNCSGRCKFVKVDNIKDKKMEIRIYKSNNNPF